MTTTNCTDLGTTKEVNALRKAGQISEAFELATELLAVNPENIWNKRAMGWVLLEMMKSNTGTIPKKRALIKQLIALKIPNSDEIFYEQFRWKLGGYLFEIAKTETENLDWMADTLAQIFVGNSISTMYLLNAILKNQLYFSNFIGLVSNWGWSNFSESDCEQAVSSNGKPIPSLAERTYIAASKSIIEQNIIFSPMAFDFILQLGNVTVQHPNWNFARYYYAILLQKCGRKNEALAAFIPFAKRKSKEFWVWDLLATLHEEDLELQMACFAKALLCDVPDKFSLKIRFKLAEILISKGDWKAASIEIDTIMATRIKNNWKISSELNQFKENVKYQKPIAGSNNYILYTSLKHSAEMILHHGIPFQLGVIWNINQEKNTAQFFVDDTVNGGFSLKGKNLSLSIGDVVRIQTEKSETQLQAFYKVLNIRATTDLPLSSQVKSFTGQLRIIGRIGLIGDVMIASNFLTKLSTNQEYKGVAVVSYDFTRKKWGWKAIKIND